VTASHTARSSSPLATAVAPVRVMCVDDHRLMREGIRRIVALQPDMVVVAEASNGTEAIEQFQQHKPDVTLMDLQLPMVN
jgi:DNA-binding NarL/FixJ family response regulator